MKPEHCKLLEDMIKGYEDDSLAEYYKVPNRGKHYSAKWATPVTDGSESGQPATGGTTGAKNAKDKKKGNAITDRFVDLEVTAITGLFLSFRSFLVFHD